MQKKKKKTSKTSAKEQVFYKLINYYESQTQPGPVVQKGVNFNPTVNSQKSES